MEARLVALRTGRWWGVLLLCSLVFVWASAQIDRVHRPSTKDTITVAVPPAIQALLMVGDRYLAANLGVLRVVILSVEDLDQAGVATMAAVQADVAKLNPCHEDNYYLAQAFLPWLGAGKANFEVQRRAVECRTWDFLPPFFMAFDLMYFDKRFDESGHYFRVAADRSPPQMRETLLNTSAKFYEKADDPALAIAIIEGIAKDSRDFGLKQFLAKRVERLQGLIALRKAANDYYRDQGNHPPSLEALVGHHYLERLPADPLGAGYAIGKDGIVIVAPLDQKK